MTQKKIKDFMDENYLKPSKTFSRQTKPIVNHIDDISSLNIFERKDYGTEKYRGCRYVLIVIDNFSMVRWVVLPKNAQTKRHSVGKPAIGSKSSPNLIQWKRVLNKFFTDFFNKNKIERY